MAFITPQIRVTIPEIPGEPQWVEDVRGKHCDILAGQDYQEALICLMGS